MYLLGYDVGSSSVKASLVDVSPGKCVSSAFYPKQKAPIKSLQPGWAEQDPEDWFQAVVRGLKVILEKSKVNPADIAGVSYSGQMHGLVALDENNEVIRPSILWCDQRTQAQCDWITEKAGGLEGLLSYTNNRMLTGYTGGNCCACKSKSCS